jgi:hypothetical protein
MCVSQPDGAKNINKGNYFMLFAAYGISQRAICSAESGIIHSKSENNHSNWGKRAFPLIKL